MNEELVRKLNVALTMHYKKLSQTKERGIFLIQESDCINAHASLIFYKIEHVKSQFDTNQRMIQWVLKQLHEYSPEVEVVFGIIVSREEILSHVVRL
jgi:hypothetical protein